MCARARGGGGCCIKGLERVDEGRSATPQNDSVREEKSLVENPTDDLPVKGPTEDSMADPVDENPSMEIPTSDDDLENQLIDIKSSTPDELFKIGSIIEGWREYSVRVDLYLLCA